MNSRIRRQANAPARIAYVYVSLPVGGAEQHLATLLAFLDRAKFAPTVVCLSEPGAIGERLAASGVSLKAFGLPSKRLWLPWRLGRVAAYFREQAFDVVHTHMYHPNTYGRLAAGWAGVPRRIATVHTTEARPRLKHRLVNRLLDRMTDCTIVVAEEAARVLSATSGIPRAKIVVIHNGVDTDRFRPGAPDAPLRAALQIPLDALVVCTVARLEPEKRHVDLVAAFRRVKTAAPRAHLLLVGGGRREAEVREQVRALGLEGCVTLTGMRADIPDLLRASDLFALASDREGLPVSVVEAMASGLPVVTSRVGGIPELLGSEAGILFEPGDRDALAEALSRCLADEALRRRLGANGRRRAEAEFAARRMARRVEAVYERSLGWPSAQA